MYVHDHFDNDDRLMSLGLSVRAYNYCVRNGIKTVTGLIEYFHSNNDSFPPGINAGKTTVKELSFICQSLVSGYNLNSDVTTKETGIKSWGLSTRAYNCCQSLRLTTISDLVRYYLSNNCSIPPQPNAGKKTIEEISNLCSRFIKEDPTLADTLGIQTYNSPGDGANEIFNLSEEDKAFLSTFQENHIHIPILWLTSKLIEGNADIFCFAYAYGIDNAKGQKSVAELADHFKVTVTRAGQRVNNGYNELFNLSDPKQHIKGFKSNLSKIFCTEKPNLI